MILVDGVPSGTVGVADRGLNYGDGLFETLRLHAGRVPLLERHLARLREGCRRLALPWPGDEVLTSDVGRVGESGGDGVIKIVLTRGDGGRGYTPSPGASGRRIVGRHPLAAAPEGPVVVGVCATPVGRSPALAGLKHLGRLEQVLAAAEVAAAGWFEGLMLDEDRRVAEATRHHLFVVRGGRLLTPALSAAGVAGIGRALVLETADAAGIGSDEEDLREADLGEIDEAFLTNAVTGLVRVGRLAGRAVRTGETSARIAEGLRARGMAWLAG